MKVELLETEREYLENTLRYNVEMLKDYLNERDMPDDIIHQGRDLVRIGQILEKLKLRPEPVPNLKPASKKKKRSK